MDFWSFEVKHPKSIHRDPFEAEFFTGEDDDDRDGSRTDSLVREVLQNSLDAATGDGPVRVRIAIDRDVQLLSPKKALRYLDGLLPHLEALGNPLLTSENSIPEMDYMVIEDFGTHGLTGDPARNSDPVKQPTRLPESFYWFWRNVGRSGKGGSSRGRWGLGKTVFPSASKINTFFGLTRRSADDETLLFGQAITRIHSLGGQEFLPEGFFNDPEKSDQLQMPFRQGEMTSLFTRDFRLTRSNEPGLSLVIPYPVGKFPSKDLARSVIVHFFWPIMLGELEVEVDGDGDDDYLITMDTIEDVASKLKWSGPIRKKQHAPPPFRLIRWAQSQTRGQVSPPRLNEDRSGRVPSWEKSLIPADLLSSARDRYDDHEPVALEVPISIEKKDGTYSESYFRVFMQKHEESTTSADYFVREGMTISGISTLSGIRGVEAIVMVDQGELSRLLGDAEGPTHTEWGTGEARPDETFVRWKRRVTFVRNAVKNLTQLFSPPPEELQVDWLNDLFSIDLPEPGVKKKPRAKPGKPGEQKPTPPSPPDTRPRSSFLLSGIEGGLKIESDPKAGSARSLGVRVAYDIPSGNPLDKWSHHDFKFSEADVRQRFWSRGPSSSGIRFHAKGAKIVDLKDNEFNIVPEGAEFEVQIDGFDPDRDLYCRVTPQADES